MAVDRGGRNNKRQMRAFQKLAAAAIDSLALIEGDGISFTGDQINVDLKDTDPGLSFHTTGLQVLLGTDPGLTLASGLAISVAAGQPFSLSGGLTLDLTTNGGLEIASNALGINLDTDPALALGAGGLSVEVEAGEPFDKVGGLSLELTTGGGLETISSELGINLDTDPGLELSATGLKVDVVTDGELILSAGGLDHAYPPGRHTDIDLRTTAATLYDATAGEFILIDTSLGNQSVRLPDPTLNDGQSVTIKLVGGETISFLIIAQHLNNYTGLIEDSPLTGGGTSFITVTNPNACYVITSDGVDWWITKSYLSFITTEWRPYDLKQANWTTTGTHTAEIELINISVDIQNTMVFMGAFIHTSQGWFTFNNGEVDIDIEITDDSSIVSRYLIPTHTVYPQTITSATGRSPLEIAALHAAEDVIVKAVFTVRAGTADIDDVAQGKSTLWLLWGNLGPDTRNL